MKEKSIIIIEAGLTGLSAGCYARMNGYKTKIFEMHNIPGGLCTSWKRKEYIIDGCIHYMMGSRYGTYHRFYEELGAAQNREMIDTEELMRIEGSGGDTWIVYTDIDRLEKHMKELSPEDTPVIEELCSCTRRFLSFEIPAEKPMEMMGIFDMLKMMKYIPALKTMGKYSGITMQDYAKRFKSPFLREVFPMIIEDIPDMPMMGVFFLLSYLHNKNNGWPAGGSLEFARAIEKRYLDLGGEVQYRARVEKILVESDRAVGVLLTDGSTHLADMVISAADGRTTIFDMLDGKYVDDRIKHYYNEWPIFEAYVQVSLGVASDFSELPHSIMLQLEAPLKVGDQIREYIPVKHYCYDPSMAPEGKSVVTASFIFTNYEYWKELSIDRLKYKAEKKALADEVISRLEMRFPGITKKVEVIDVATPVTYERYTGNWRGSYMGWKSLPSATGREKGMSKTLPGLDCFYMGGQWVFPGGGVPGAIAAGRHLIQTICRKGQKKFTSLSV